jgi:hypothetical protein
LPNNAVFGVYLLIRKRAGLRYIRRLLASSSLPSGKQVSILTYFQTEVKKKMGQESAL